MKAVNFSTVITSNCKITEKAIALSEVPFAFPVVFKSGQKSKGETVTSEGGPGK